MITLDKTKPFGKVVPPWHPEDCDRAAHYEQGGRLFDAHGRAIEPGKPLAVAKAATKSAKPAANTPTSADEETSGNDVEFDENAYVDIMTLLEGAEEIPWPQFRKRAREILGPDCPSDKAGMKEALATALEKVESAKDSPQHTLPEVSSAGITMDGLSSDAEHIVGTVNLAAWARGTQQYIFGEVAKAIRAKYNKQVSERVDALDFLIEQGVVSAAAARKDI